MPKKMTRMPAVNQQFLSLIKPQFESWGLSQHPNPSTHFGDSDHGYRYDFADLRDTSNVRLASFAILQPHADLWIRGYKAGPLQGEAQDLVVLFNNIKDIFVLTRRWSILRPMTVKFALPARSRKSPLDQANELMNDVVRELPKLKKYLYGT